MKDRQELISSVLDDIEGVTLNEPVTILNEKDKPNALQTAISVVLEGIEFSFEVEIYQEYPFQYHENDTIRFINHDYLKFNHVNADGSICIHTTHSPDIFTKLHKDVVALKAWINRYAIEKTTDNHYEHIILTPRPLERAFSSFLFTQVDHNFKPDEYGWIGYSLMSKGMLNHFESNTYLIQEFVDIEKKCDWNQLYHNLEHKAGFYYFADRPPVLKENQRIAVDSWDELNNYFSDSFLDAVYKRKDHKAFKGQNTIPLLIGYYIDDRRVHWQVALMEKKNLPICGVKNPDTKQYVPQLKSTEIPWTFTYDNSYDLFFGRGRLSDALIKKPVLILGVGAVGSILAKTLVRGGLRELSFIDYDKKEPGNVCRSEYPFNSGVRTKIDDLSKLLMEISPFVELSFSHELTDRIKAQHRTPDWENKIREFLNEYGLIIDCTTDDDVLYLLNELKPETEILSLSISNGAKELICGVGDNVYQETRNIYNALPKHDIDWFNPTGCWSPTFTASYNDISVLVEYAVKHINGVLQRDQSLRSFIVESTWEEGHQMNLKPF